MHSSNCEQLVLLSPDYVERSFRDNPNFFTRFPQWQDDTEYPAQKHPDTTAHWLAKIH